MDFEKVGQLQQLAKEITSEFCIKLNDENNSVVLEQKKDNTKVEVGFHQWNIMLTQLKLYLFMMQ